MDTIHRAGGEYRGVFNLAVEVDSSSNIVRPILRRLEDDQIIKIIPASANGGRGKATTIKALTNE